MEWHEIMRHYNFQDLGKLQNEVDGMKIGDKQQHGHTICTQEKRCQTQGQKPDESPLEFVHCDLAGPINPVARHGFKYALCCYFYLSGVILGENYGVHQSFLCRVNFHIVQSTLQYSPCRIYVYFYCRACWSCQ